MARVTLVLNGLQKMTRMTLLLGFVLGAQSDRIPYSIPNATLELPPPGVLRNRSAAFPASTVAMCFGSGHANITLHPDWRRDVAYAHQALGVQYLR